MASTHGFLTEVRDYNAAVDRDLPFDPNVKDGRAPMACGVPKSNWANTLDTPPFQAFAVTCGITYTFGGLRIDPQGRVLDTDFAPIPGLFAAGELVGGVFYFNYPGGSGLTNGAVWGRIAGTGPARERTCALARPGRIAALGRDDRFSRRLRAGSVRARLEVSYIRTPPGGGSARGLHTHAWEQLFYVLSGRIEPESTARSSSRRRTIRSVTGGRAAPELERDRRAAVHLAINVLTERILDMTT